MRFDKTNVHTIKPPAGKMDHIEWDDGMPGFGIRFRNQGPGVYMIQYRINGRTGKMTFGAVARVNLADAQKKAREAFNLIHDKVDPAVERAKKAAGMVRFKDRVEDYKSYLVREKCKPKYIADVMRSLEEYFAELHRYAFPELTRALIATELNKIEKAHGPGSMATRRAHINAYLNWAVRQGLIDVNPGAATEPGPQNKRTRILQPWEIVPVWQMSDPTDDFGAICRLLWLTWARRNEIAWLRKEEVDRKRRLINLPAERCKNGIPHVIPLSRQAWAVLEPKLDQRQNSPFVFGTGKNGFSGFGAATDKLRLCALQAYMKRLRTETGEDDLPKSMDHFTLHDFRRTARSLAVRKPVSVLPHIAEAILNHVSSAESGKQGVAGVYDVNDPWQYHEEKAEALQKWADYLDSLTRPRLHMVA